MEYFILGAIVIAGLLPLSIRNLTKQRQKDVSRKAELSGVELDFEDSKNDNGDERR